MRPRGESSSLPSTRYVGQVARQNPQCTQLRRMRSATSPSGVLRKESARVVCMSEVGVEPAAVEDAPGVEALLEGAVQRRQRRRERGEGAVDGRLAAEQGGVAACLPCCFTQRAGRQL